MRGAALLLRLEEQMRATQSARDISLAPTEADGEEGGGGGGGGGGSGSGSGGAPNGSSTNGSAAPRRAGSPSVLGEDGLTEEERARLRSSQSNYAKLAEERASQRAGSVSRRSSTRRPSLIVQVAAKIPGAGMKTSWMEHKAANCTSASGGGNSTMDLEDEPGFVKKVCELMQDPHICSTFAVFDQDGSGSISTTELKEVVTMLQLASNKNDLETILDELDINKDGCIDLWEFCVYLQKTKDRRKVDETNWELDQAFQLFDTDEEGYLGVDELRRVMQGAVSGMPLDDDEFDEMVAAFGLQASGGRISIEQLREHECWQPKEFSQG